MLAIFSYEFPVAAENFKAADMKLTTLSNYDSLIEQALEKSYISEQELDSLRTWRTEPSTWNV